MGKATFPRLGLWPPVPPPSSVKQDDYDYHDTSMAVEIIAQRLYNDEQRRQDAASVDGVCRQQLLATTAMFITEFADQQGYQLPDMPHHCAKSLDQFSARVAEWESTHDDQQILPASDHHAKETWFNMFMLCVG